MIGHKKDIVILLVLFVITIFCVRFFHKKMSDDQLVASIEPLSLVIPSPQAILSVNRPAVLNKMILPMKNFEMIFSGHTPKLFHGLIQENDKFPAFLLVYYPEGVVMLSSMNQQHVKQIYDFLDCEFDYPAMEKTEYGITMHYYPDIKKQFLGCYYQNGMFVASYNNRLLKDIAQRQQYDRLQISPEIHQAVRDKGKNAAINLYIPSATLNLYVQTSDSTEWRIENKWLSSDLFYNEGKVCCVNELKYEAALDSIHFYQRLSDTIQVRMDHLLPQIKTTTQVSHDEAVAYFTTCGQ